MFDGAATDFQTEMVSGHVFERVGFVEDHDFIIGQHTAALAAQGEVAEKQGVVDDQQLGAEHLFARLEVEALGVVGASAAETIAAVALHGVPDYRKGLEAEIAAAS